MTTNYTTLLQHDVERILTPLADAERWQQRQLDALKHRLATEQGNAEALAGRLERLRASTGERLADGQNSFERYRRDLKKLTADLDTAKSMIESFVADLIPAKTRELAAAKARTQKALLDLAASHRPECENRMGEKIGLALAERDSYMSAVDAIAAGVGASFAGQNRTYPDGCCYQQDQYRSHMWLATSLTEAAFDPAAHARLPRHGPFLAPTPQEAPQEALGSTITTLDDSQDHLAPDNAPEADPCPRSDDPGMDRDMDMADEVPLVVRVDSPQGQERLLT